MSDEYFGAGIPPIDLAALDFDVVKDRLQRIASPGSRLQDLIVTTEFVVRGVRRENQRVVIPTSMWEKPIVPQFTDPYARPVGGLVQPILHLSGRSSDMTIPVELIKFVGYSTVEEGDRITVNLLPYTKRMTSMQNPLRNNETIQVTRYDARELTSSEEAIEIENIRRDGRRVAGSERALDYDWVMKHDPSK